MDSRAPEFSARSFLCPQASTRASPRVLGYSGVMAKSLPVHLPPDDLSEQIPVAPSAEAWRAMAPAAQLAFLDQALLALQDEAWAAPEGGPHITAKTGVRRILGDYYRRIGRKIYLAGEMPVHYPGARVFAPDFFAVVDVEDPGDDEWRRAWVVADEGRGLDLVLEVLFAGDPRKDLVRNVARYADLQIQEYFVYDRLNMRLHGFRLPWAAATTYQSIPARGGYLASRVLGLDLSIQDGHLRFYHGGAMVPETRDLLDRANALVDALEQKAEAEAQRAEAEAQRADQEAAARQALEARVAELLARLGEG